MTTHCWGEKAAGDWVLEIYDSPSQLRSQKVPGRTTLWQSSAQMFYISGIQSFVRHKGSVQFQAPHRSQPSLLGWGGGDVGGPICL